VVERPIRVLEASVADGTSINVWIKSADAATKEESTATQGATAERVPGYGELLSDKIRTTTQDFSKLNDFEKIILGRRYLYDTEEELKARYDRPWKASHGILVTAAEFTVEARPFYIFTQGDLAKIVWQHPKVLAIYTESACLNLLFMLGVGILAIFRADGYGAGIYLSLPPSDRRNWNKLARRGLAPEEIDNQMAMIVGLTKRAIKGDAKVAKVVIDLLGESPAEDSEGGVQIIDGL